MLRILLNVYGLVCVIGTDVCRIWSCGCGTVGGNLLFLPRRASLA